MVNENIVYEGKISIVALLISLIIDFFLCVILIGLWYLVRDIIAFLTTKLAITNKRVSGHVGLINTNDLDCPLNKVTGIQIKQDLFGKMFNYGTIIITTAANTFNYRCISNPSVFRQKANDQIEIYDDERIKKQAKELASAMKD